jgi:DNA-binding response OmpR family regulator
MGMRLLVIEDDADIAGLIARDLHGAGYTVDTVGLVESGLNAALDIDYAAIVLDLRLPDGDGLDLVRRLRQRGLQAPILILTGRRRVADRVAGLRAGADDYLVKPFATAELRARLVALRRRARIQAPASPGFADIAFDPDGVEVTVASHPLALARQELRLLRLLVERGGHMVSKRLIEETLYGFDEDVASNAVEVHIHKLRRALSEAGSATIIETRRGLGYRLDRRMARAE